MASRPLRVHLQPVQRGAGQLQGDAARRPRTWAKSRTPAQQPVGDAGRAAGAAWRSPCAPSAVQRHAEDARRAVEDELQVLGLVVVEPLLDLEAVAQRRGEQARCGWWRRSRVKGGRSIFIARAAGPVSMVMSSRKSSIAG